MKKLTLVLALLVSFGLVGAFAQTVAPVVDFSASAEAVFGVDLNADISTGFTNTAEADLSITWIDETVENEGEGVYGWIQIEELDITAAIDEESDDDEMITGTVGDINARVYFSPAYLQVSTAPGFGFNNADQIRKDATEDNDPIKSLGSTDIITTNGGVIFGADGLAGMIDVAFKVGSADTYVKNSGATTPGLWNATFSDADFTTGSIGNTGWQTGAAPAVGYVGGTNPAATYDAAVGAGNVVREVTVYNEYAAGTGNTQNTYAYGLDVTVTPMDILSIGLGVVFTDDSGSANKLGFTLNPVLTLPVMSGLTVAVPADVAINRALTASSKADSILFEVAPEVTLSLTEGGSNFMVKGFFKGETEPVSTTTKALLDMKVGFEEVETDGFVPNLAAGVFVSLYDMLDTKGVENGMGFGIDANVSYAVGAIKPYAEAQYLSNSAVGAGENYDIVPEDGIVNNRLALEAGVELSMVENTVFKMAYASSNLTDDKVTTHTSTGAAGTDAGRITFSAKVSY